MSSSGGLLTRPLVVFVQNAAVQVTKLTSTDAFVVVDLPDAPESTGIIRCGRRILQDGAASLARTLTYTYAAFGQQRGGASAGINAEGDGRDVAVSAAVAELGPKAAEGRLLLDHGKGVGAAEVAAWRGRDPRRTDVDATGTLAAGVVAAAGAASGGLAGAIVTVEAGPAADAVAAAATAAGATATVLPSAEALAATGDVLVVGSRVGLVDHTAADALGVRLVVPSGALPVTARGLATASRRGIRVLPDFVTTAGPVLAAWDAAAPDGASAAATAAGRIAEVVAAAAAHPAGDFLGACAIAEDFLRSWCSELPFGRPLA